MQPLFEADKVGIVRQCKEDGKEESSQTSDEVEWDDTSLKENTQAALAKNSVMPSEDATSHDHLEERHSAHLERDETAMQAA